jgi:hypothetical protein
MHSHLSERQRAILARLPPWLGPASSRAARFSPYGPAWVPRHIRDAPLWVLCQVRLAYFRGWL